MPGTSTREKFLYMCRTLPAYLQTKSMPRYSYSAVRFPYVRKLEPGRRVLTLPWIRSTQLGFD